MGVKPQRDVLRGAAGVMLEQQHANARRTLQLPVRQAREPQSIQRQYYQHVTSDVRAEDHGTRHVHGSVCVVGACEECGMRWGASLHGLRHTGL